jgi:hypothetical protein
MSLFIFLELSRALNFDDACELLRFILDRRDQLLHKGTERLRTWLNPRSTPLHPTELVPRNRAEPFRCLRWVPPPCM